MVRVSALAVDKRVQFKAAAINTVSGVSMTTRKQMLKIKVGTYLPSGPEQLLTQ
jgi:hypothetical protein